MKLNPNAIQNYAFVAYFCLTGVAYLLALSATSVRVVEYDASFSQLINLVHTMLYAGYGAMMLALFVRSKYTHMLAITAIMLCIWYFIDYGLTMQLKPFESYVIGCLKHSFMFVLMACGLAFFMQVSKINQSLAIKLTTAFYACLCFFNWLAFSFYDLDSFYFFIELMFGLTVIFYSIPNGQLMNTWLSNCFGKFVEA